MYLHLGQSVAVPHREILGIFDLDNASWAYKTREFLEQAEAEGQPVAEIAEAAAQGAEITTELNGQELTITAHDPETMEVAFNVTGERRKALVEAVKAFIDAPAVYQNAPSFAYVSGDYTVSKTGTVSGPANEALMAALNAKGFIAE